MHNNTSCVHCPVLEFRSVSVGAIFWRLCWDIVQNIDIIVFSTSTVLTVFLVNSSSRFTSNGSTMVAILVPLSHRTRSAHRITCVFFDLISFMYIVWGSQCTVIRPLIHPSSHLDEPTDQDQLLMTSLMTPAR